jgi:hypothetical protein
VAAPPQWKRSVERPNESKAESSSQTTTLTTN